MNEKFSDKLNSIKWIGLFTMTIDHIGYFLFPNLIFFAYHRSYRLSLFSLQHNRRHKADTTLRALYLPAGASGAAVDASYP